MDQHIIQTATESIIARHNVSWTQWKNTLIDSFQVKNITISAPNHHFFAKTFIYVGREGQQKSKYVYLHYPVLEVFPFTLQQTEQKLNVQLFHFLKALSAFHLTTTRTTAEWIAQTETTKEANAILLAMPIMHWTALHSRFVLTMATVTALERGQIRRRNVTVSRIAIRTC